MAAFAFIFWASVLFIVYTYVGYPLVLFALSSLVQIERDLVFLFRRGERRRRRDDARLPGVTLGFAAYNEEDVIEEKVRNCLALNYPREKLEILVISDGSNDQTEVVVAKYLSHGIRLLADGERRGKAARMNQIVEMASSPVVVFSDANTIYDPDALNAIVRHFEDERVGAVCGEVRLTGPSGELESESLYWRYEVVLKFLENKLDLVIGSNGPIYAVRREYYEPIPDDTIVDDFVIPMLIRGKGYRLVYDPEAVAHEKTTGSLEGEMIRRQRIGAGNWQAASMLRGMLHPLQGRVAFSFWSHKVFRWSVPLAMIVALVSNLPLVGRHPYGLLMLLQVAFYAAAGVGHLTGGQGGLGRLCRVPQTFVEMNLGLLSGLVRFVSGSQRVTWARRTRQPAPARQDDDLPQLDELMRASERAGSRAEDAPIPLDEGDMPLAATEEAEPRPGTDDEDETKELPMVEPPGPVDDNKGTA